MNNGDASKVDEIRVSQGTRAMTRGETSVGYNEAIAERDALQNRRRQNDTRLAAINNRIRGRKLPEDEYRRLCDEQQELKTDSASCEKRLIELKRLCWELSQLESKDRNDRRDELWERVARMEGTLAEIKRKLDKLLELSESPLGT